VVGLNSHSSLRLLTASNSRCLQLVINQPPGHSSSSSSSHEASGTDNGDEIRHQHCCGLFITSHFHSALPDVRMPSHLLSLVRLQSSSLNRQPSNRPTLPICLDTNTRTARPAAVYSEVCSVAQAACTAPESCLSRRLSGRPGFASVVSRRLDGSLRIAI